MAKRPQVALAPNVSLKIAGGEDIGYMFIRFEWKSFVNGGYVIKASLEDPEYSQLGRIVKDYYLDKGRRSPTKVVFELKWPGAESTLQHIAYITHLSSHGVHNNGVLEFIAVDPPSYWLNAGDSAGKVYTGCVSDVIKKVVKEYYVDPDEAYSGKKAKIEVTETSDSKSNQWWMMRQDPKTFINSLLDWSSSLTKKKTNWMVSTDGNTKEEPSLWIKEQADRTSVNYGLYYHNTEAPSAEDTVGTFEFLGDNFMSVFNKSLITHGISATSGAYYDRKMDKNRKIVHVYDENTSEKKNVKISDKQGFAKPKDNSSIEKPFEWSTSIKSVPQFSAGDLGIKYRSYIDGRARQSFLNMLNLVMRIKLEVAGDPSPDLANSHNLGVSRLKIAWKDQLSGDSYFLDGDWMVYGFVHVVDRGVSVGWKTDLYCYRLDHDAESRKIS